MAGRPRSTPGAGCHRLCYKGAVPRRLTPEHLAAIASAPPDIAPAELARQLGLPREPVGRTLRRFRRAGGWFCELRLPPCTECGETVVGPPKQITHAACVSARQARWAREKRAQRNANAAPEVLQAHPVRERAAASRHYHGRPEERRSPEDA